MLAMVLARTRQLAAHETGHTLGLAHNFAASSFPHTPEESVSVMDYPHPYITLNKEGIPDLSPQLRRQHRHLGQGRHRLRLPRIRQVDSKAENPPKTPPPSTRSSNASEKTGLVYITDEDARPLGGAHPHAHLWDNGTDPADELNRILTIRAAASPASAKTPSPPAHRMAQLEDTLVPLYLLHRYQTEAAIKEIGGLDYRYNLRGDGQPSPEIVPSAEQKKALDRRPQNPLPRHPHAPRIPPENPPAAPARPPTHPRILPLRRPASPSTPSPPPSPPPTSPSTSSSTPPAPHASSSTTCASPTPPSLRGVLEAISKTTAERPEGGHTMSSEVERAVEFRALEAMLSLAVNPQPPARPAPSPAPTSTISSSSGPPPPRSTDTAEAIHRAALIDRINDFNRDPAKFIPAKPIEAPPGMPIGDPDAF